MCVCVVYELLTADNVRADYTDVVEHVRPEPWPERNRRQNCDRFPGFDVRKKSRNDGNGRKADRTRQNKTKKKTLKNTRAMDAAITVRA